MSDHSWERIGPSPFYKNATWHKPDNVKGFPVINARWRCQMCHQVKSALFLPDEPILMDNGSDMGSIKLKDCETMRQEIVDMVLED